MRRGSGVLLHISSLPGPFGVGTMGKPAYDFVDQLYGAEQIYWQILPCTPPGYGDSPYQSTSAFAGNPAFIDLDLLVEEGLLDESDLADLPKPEKPDAADYALEQKTRPPLLLKAYRRGIEKYAADFHRFKQDNGDWLFDYSLFEAFRAHFGEVSWKEWPEEIRRRDPEAEMRLIFELTDEIDAVQFTQFLFFEQWRRLREYANQKEVHIVGDIPLYVSPDSVEAWAYPYLFRRDHAMAGTPPDAFSADGQNWGNPIYDWHHMAENGYDWWVKRMRHNLMQYDYVRFDHFRGIESYYVIPEGAPAKDGHWEQGPGRALIDTLRYHLGELPIIAEDLGFLTQGVHDLLAYCGFAGTKVLQFAFDDENSIYLPHNYQRNCAVYTGTHDNNTTRGWFSHDLIPAVKDRLEAYFSSVDAENISDLMTRAAMMSIADVAITPMQDILGLPQSARMNYPSISLGNWKWRLTEGQFDASHVELLRRMTHAYGRSYREWVEPDDHPEQEQQFDAEEAQTEAGKTRKKASARVKKA